jgi:hypothetical protein
VSYRQQQINVATSLDTIALPLRVDIAEGERFDVCFLKMTHNDAVQIAFDSRKSVISIPSSKRTLQTNDLKPHQKWMQVRVHHQFPRLHHLVHP